MVVPRILGIGTIALAVAWVEVERVDDPRRRWIESGFRVGEFVTPTDNVRVRFSVTDVAPNSQTEAALDASNIIAVICDDRVPTLPKSLEVTRGVLRSGALEDLFDSDNAYVDVEPRRPTEVAAASVEIEVTTTSPPQEPSLLSFIVETAASGSPARLHIELFNYEIDDWELVEQRDASAGDTVVEVSFAANPARFVDPDTGEMSARIGYHDRGITFPAWGGRFDRAIWTVK